MGDFVKGSDREREEPQPQDAGATPADAKSHHGHAVEATVVGFDPRRGSQELTLEVADEGIPIMFDAMVHGKPIDLHGRALRAANGVIVQGSGHTFRASFANIQLMPRDDTDHDQPADLHVIIEVH